MPPGFPPGMVEHTQPGGPIMEVQEFEEPWSRYARPKVDPEVVRR